MVQDVIRCLAFPNRPVAVVMVLMTCLHPASAARLDRLEPPLHLEAPELELPTPVRYDDLGVLSVRLSYARCRTTICMVWFKIDVLYDLSYNGRGPQGQSCSHNGGKYPCPDKYRVTSRQLDRSLAEYPARRPLICDALAAIAARDDGTEAAHAHPDFGAYTLDLARRLTTPKLNCIAKVKQAFQPIPYRDEALRLAISLCHDEHAPARECARLQGPWP